jgi:hypothetical protein
MGGRKDDDVIKPEVPESPDTTGEPGAEPHEEGAMSTYLYDEQPAPGTLSDGEPAPDESGDKGMHTAGTLTEDFSALGGSGLPTDGIPLPPSESISGAPPISEVVYQEPGPTEGMESPQAPVQAEALPPDPEMVHLFVSDERIRNLWVRADEARNNLNLKIHTLEIARALLDQIKYARNYLLAGRGYYEEAERHINEVEYRVVQNDQSREWSRAIGFPLFIYEVIWAIVLGILFYWNSQVSLSESQTDLRFVIASMICGGFGGVMGAWLALIKHIAQEQDFDKQHSMWYLNSPLMGIGIGAFVYMIMRAGLISLTGSTSQSITSPYIIYVLAWLAGYQHNVFTELVKRVIKVFFESSQPAQEAKAEEAPKEPGPPTPLPLPEQAPEEGPSRKE